MSQPHPPIPEPQPAPADGTGSTAASAAGLSSAPPPAPGPRTQSILVPPGQQQPAEPVHHPEPFRTAQFPAVRDEPAASPVPGSSDPGAPPAGPPPVPGPLTAPVATSQPHAETHPVSAPAQPAAQPAPGHRAGAPSSGVRRAAGDRRVLAGLGLGVLALVLLETGLLVDDDTRSLWNAVPTWSAFATLAALVALVPLAVALLGRGLPARTAWRVGAGGVAALGAFWVLVGLPLVVSDRGFWLTAALGAAGAAVWLAPGRPE